jgi:hypothetical protein
MVLLFICESKTIPPVLLLIPSARFNCEVSNTKYTRQHEEGFLLCDGGILPSTTTAAAAVVIVIMLPLFRCKIG